MIELTLDELREAARAVYAVMPPTPQYAWPLLARAAGCEVWVKHENHTPIAAFKLRGGIVYLADVRAREPGCAGVVAATRGNHGQSIALAASRAGLRAVIVVPEGNNPEKNDAMSAQGAELVVEGADFQAALEHARGLAEAEGLHMVPSFDRLLVKGVASYALELLEGAPPLDAVYVPIGLGSGICGVIGARDALGLKTRVVGVVSDRAACYSLSLQRNTLVRTDSALTFADGMAVRTPDPAALEIIRRGAERVVEVSDDEVAEAIRILFSDTHSTAEGAGAAALAGFIKNKTDGEKRVAVILTGQNIDRPVMQEVLAGRTPRVA